MTSGTRMAVAAAMTVLLSACDTGGCTQAPEPAVEVSVVDAATGLAVVDSVTVVVRDGDFEETLFETSSGVYSGAGDREGEYTVVVAHPRYEPWVRDRVRVIEDRCHVRTAYLAAELVAR
ncbi:hypothetical protein [Gaopeijia maritima]|uniref:Carboxypeptidase regulatory-like domain-containing protein n=1 Tax=Gaopeijia maritima TaxID=3119007 RepID=A0ABU9EF25_9BACT